MSRSTEPDPERALIASAVAVARKAYAPYSGFHVGAAVRDSGGRIHAGANVENAAYPQGVCAEAAAIAAMVAAGGRRIEAIAVAGPGPVEEAALCTPCGGCRQKIREFAAPETPVLVCGPEGLRRRFTLGELLPASFGPENLQARPRGG
jgi:cytidine deaminase